MLLEASKIKKIYLDQLEEIVGRDAYSVAPLDRLNYSRDSNFKCTIQNIYNKTEFLPDIIVWPQTTDQVQRLVKLAIKNKTPLIPFGAGSGVCGGTLAVYGGMMVDLKRMNRLIKLDTSNLLAEVECGMMGLHLEDELQRKGYTLGHTPSSILCASVGGYLAARSAGQQSTRYGKIEDMVHDFEVVTGTGDVIRTRNVANGGGIDLNQIFLGSEGTLGLMTKVSLRVYPLPEHTALRGIRFKNLKTAIEAIRRIMQSGIKPSVVRLYDSIDTLIHLSSKVSDSKIKLPKIFGSVGKIVESKSLQVALAVPQTLQILKKFLPSGLLVVFMFEGYERMVKEEEKIVLEISRGLGGEDLGKEPGEYWLANRYHVSYKASELFYAGAFTDTIEVATTWDRIHNLYTRMIRALSPFALVMAHMSHVYTDGGSLYFTFIAPLKGLKKSEELYDRIWDKAMTTCQKAGGVISHHHGIGRLKAKFMEEEWGEGALLFHSLKDLYDPHRILNPGKLFLEKKVKKGKDLRSR